MKKVINPDKKTWAALLERPAVKVESIETTVKTIFDDIKRNGDSDVLRYTSLFDGVQLDSLRVTTSELNNAKAVVSDELKDAINLAKENITKFHKAQATTPVKVDTVRGVTCWQEKRPIERVGLYIPGGTAPLFSSVLMLAIPAQLAGCKEVVLVTPPNKKGEINPAILYTAALCGITSIFKTGGIQAIAALTFGTDTIPAVYKIFGPGNQYVTAAKQWATKFGVAIDMPAGPSELLVVTDESADPAFVAADLLSQAEHGTDSQVILVSTSKKVLDGAMTALKEQLNKISRKSIAEQALKYAKMIYVETKTTAMELINAYGPEHLIICSKESDYYVKNISNAGSVFIGNYTPESAGDYASGTNHTLPTNGFSKAYSGVNLDSFLKSITFQEITPEGLNNIGSSIAIMAEAEGLDAHSNAVRIRLKSLKNN